MSPTILLRDSARPRAASVVFAASVLLNLFGGRITFLVGLAAAMLAVLALVRRHPWLAGPPPWSASSAARWPACSPGIVAAAVLLSDPSRRREALVVGARHRRRRWAPWRLLFHNPGVMGSPPGQMFLALLGLALVVVACREPTIRVGAVIVAIGLVACMVVPNSVGLNLTRMVWLLAAPLIVGYGHRPDRHVVALTALALIFPTVDVTWQLAEADSPSASASYYTPLLGQLRDRMNTDASIGQRVEVVEPETKGAARYVGESMPVARGWERQADVTDNPIFYTDGALNAASYRQWLDELAVAYVAVPDAKLDFASVDEAKLIAGGLPYLREVWHNQDWKLYQVHRLRAAGAPCAGALRGRQPAAALGAAAVRGCRSRSAGRTTSRCSTAPSRCRPASVPPDACRRTGSGRFCTRRRPAPTCSPPTST